MTRTCDGGSWNISSPTSPVLFPAPQGTYNVSWTLNLPSSLRSSGDNVITSVDCIASSSVHLYLCSLICDNPGNCSDGIMNGGETDIDCGGVCPCCKTNHAGCSNVSDCCIPDQGFVIIPGLSSGGITVGKRDPTVTNYCSATLNQCGSCTDGLLGPDEGGIDCGGPCPCCGLGSSCTLASQCCLGQCNGGKCQAVGCSNLIKDGLETDIDCGGGGCPKCGSGQACLVGSDCTSGTCTGSFCSIGNVTIGKKKKKTTKTPKDALTFTWGKIQWNSTKSARTLIRLQSKQSLN